MGLRFCHLRDASQLRSAVIGGLYDIMLVGEEIQRSAVRGVADTERVLGRNI